MLIFYVLCQYECNLFTLWTVVFKDVLWEVVTDFPVIKIIIYSSPSFIAITAVSACASSGMQLQALC